MRKKLFSLVLAVALLLPVFASCSSVKEGPNIVSKDDPWFETTRFELEKDLEPYDNFCNSAVCVADDKIFDLYCHGNAASGNGVLTLSTYDMKGSLKKSVDISAPGAIYSLYNAFVDPKGKTITAVTYLNGYKFLSIDTKSGEILEEKDLLNSEARQAMGDMFLMNVEVAGDYQILVLDGGLQTITYSMLLFKNTEFVAKLDLSSVNLGLSTCSFSIDESTSSIYTSGMEFGEFVNLEFDLNTGKLKNKTIQSEIGSDEINFANYKTTAEGDMCNIDSLGNITMIDPDTMTPKSVVETNWYTPVFYSENTEEYWTESNIISCKEDRTIIKDSVSRSYTHLGMSADQHEYIRILNKTRKNPHAGKEIIEIALPLDKGVSEYLSKAITEFNKTDNEYLIRVWNKYDKGFNPFVNSFATFEEDDMKVYEMIQDLKSNEAPDIAIGIQKNYAMRDDIFMDLTGFLDQDIMDKQYSNIIEACRLDGKLYFLPVTLEIEGLITNESLIKDDAVGITFEDFDKMVKEDLNGFSPYDYACTDTYNKSDFILSCIDTKSAIEGDTADFETDQFRAATEYAKNNFEYDTANDFPADLMYDYSRSKGQCCYANIDSFISYVLACYNSKDTYKIIGTPSVDASGPRFKAIETVSVSSTTNVENGCRKFLNYLFSGAAFESAECEFKNIVTNKDIMNRNIDIVTEKNNRTYDRYLEDKKNGILTTPPEIELAYGDKSATAEMKELFLSSLSSITTYYYEDHAIVTFLSEELAPYYVDQRSIDDVINILNDRVTKYIKEM